MDGYKRRFCGRMGAKGSQRSQGPVVGVVSRDRVVPTLTIVGVVRPCLACGVRGADTSKVTRASQGTESGAEIRASRHE